MMQHLVLHVHLHEDAGGTARYHGVREGSPEWPPAPARVFQALVAGAARGQSLTAEAAQALRWFETLPPPVIGTPRRSLGQAVSLFVPNNDADALPQPYDVSSIRTLKRVQPSLLQGGQEFVFAWPFEPGEDRAEDIRVMADELYQFGRGTDMAWARAQVTDTSGVDQILASCEVVYRPQEGDAPPSLEYPTRGTLDSLLVRHNIRSFATTGVGRRSKILFANRPKPRFAPVSYGRSEVELTYELRDRTQARPWPWALGQAASLVELLRDLAAARLRAGMPSASEAIERCLVGRTTEGKGAVPVHQRVTITALPSIGSPMADQAIRRVLVRVPSSSSLRPDDVDWAFSGLERVDADTGELSPWLLVRSQDDKMLGHYRRPSRRWRTVTAAALPAEAARRRMEPARLPEVAKGAPERIAEEDRALTAVRVALRHVGVQARLLYAHVQREPLSAKGLRAEVFADRTRFEKERMWHVEIELDREIDGPVALGDGRFLGLGVMEPVSERHRASGRPGKGQGPVVVAPEVDGGVWVWHTHALECGTSPEAIPMARAFRRAVMSCVRDSLGAKPDQGLDAYFCGHEAPGATAPSEDLQHLSFQWDVRRQRLVIIAPYVLQRRGMTPGEVRHSRTLDRAVDGLQELLAGPSGRFALDRARQAMDDSLWRPSMQWVSVTPYAVTRHVKHATAHQALAADALSECLRCGLPRPQVTVLSAQGVSGSGLQGELRLKFEIAVAGPIALGRTSHLGGGLFEAV